MKITEAQIKDYETYARNPDNWVLAARRNLAIAHLLTDRLNESRGLKENNLYERSGCFYASYFHAGVAIENALKAVLISRDPSIVKNGTLDIKKFGSQSGHALLNPVIKIIGTLTDSETKYLIKLEEFTWAGRYSVPIKPDSLYDEKKMKIIRLSSSKEKDILDSIFNRLVESIS